MISSSDELEPSQVFISAGITMLSTIFTISVALMFAFKYYKRRLFYNKVKNIPSPPSLPFFGHALLFAGSVEKIQDTIMNLHEKYEKIMGIWLGPFLNIAVVDPKYLKAIMGDKSKTKKGQAYHFLKPAIGHESILRLNGPQFDQDKKIIMQTFSSKNVVASMDIFQENCEIIVNLMAQELGRGVFDAGRYISQYTMYNLLEAGLGVHKDILTDQEITEFNTAIQKIGEYACERSLKVWLYPDFLFNFSDLKRKQSEQIKITDRISRKCIQHRKDLYQEDLENSGQVASKRKMFIDGFLSHVKPNGEKCKEDEIKNEVVTVMLAGHETTLTTIGFALSFIGQHQDVQQKACEELHQIFGDSSRPATYEDISKMEYLEQIICETWRLRPSINHFARTALEDIHVDGYTIPKDTQVYIPLNYIHLNGETFPDPKKFNPDHFLPEAMNGRHPYSYMPFSIGYRKCIGVKFANLSVKIFLANFLRKFKVSSEHLDVKKNFSVVPVPENGFRISITEI